MIIITRRRFLVGCWNTWFDRQSFRWQWRTRILSNCASWGTSLSSTLSISLKMQCWLTRWSCWHRWKWWLDLRGFRPYPRLWLLLSSIQRSWWCWRPYLRLALSSRWWRCGWLFGQLFYSWLKFINYYIRLIYSFYYFLIPFPFLFI